MGHTGRRREVPGEDAQGTGWRTCQRDTPVRTRCPCGQGCRAETKTRALGESQQTSGGTPCLQIRRWSPVSKESRQVRAQRVTCGVHLGSRRQKNVQGTEWWQRTARVLRWSTPAVTTEYYTLGHVRNRTSFSRFWRLSSPSPRCWQVEFPLRPLLVCSHGLLFVHLERQDARSQVLLLIRTLILQDQGSTLGPSVRIITFSGVRSPAIAVWGLGLQRANLWGSPTSSPTRSIATQSRSETILVIPKFPPCVYETYLLINFCLSVFGNLSFLHSPG